MTWTERTKPTDVATERADVGGPGYDFSMTNIFWDRTDIYFDNDILSSTERSKPTDTFTERTKPAMNQCLSLDGSGYASIADASQTGLDMGLSDFMVEMMVKLTVPTASQPEDYAYFFVKFAAPYATTAYYEGFLHKSDESIWFIIDDSVNSAFVSCRSSYVDDLEWHRLVFVANRDSATGLKLYVDGVEVVYDTQDDPTSVDDLDNTAEFTIGDWVPLHIYKLNGQIDEVRVWNFGVGGLPTDYADYISWRNSNRFVPTSSYNSGSWNTYVTNNLSAYYKFNGDYTDETSNSNDLTAGGSGNTFLNYLLERIKPTDTWTERTKET